ncbi:MAG: SDR family oxidoreductase, partial [Rhodobacteraceae bacterium]|nr:SDR family oxidoreductase [Paracoccaceae bacterium]
MSVEGKVVLVTGASSGIGRITAQTMLNAGAKVVLTGRRAEKLNEAAQLAKPGASLCVPCDISKAEDVDRLYDAIDETFGRLDVVFNNAGNNVPAATIDEISIDDWLKVLNVNLHGAFLVARRAFAMMRHQTPQGGRIINNGSISAHMPRPGSAPYTATKH